MFQVQIPGHVNLFPLQGPHEALAFGVVIGVSRPTHAGYHLVLLQQSHVLFTSVLPATARGIHRPHGGRPSHIALSSAAIASRLVIVRLSSQPTTLRE